MASSVRFTTNLDLLAIYLITSELPSASKVHMVAGITISIKKWKCLYKMLEQQ